MKLPPVYVVFEQSGTCKPEVRDICISIKVARELVKVLDYTPHSGHWFFKKYIPQGDR